MRGVGEMQACGGHGGPVLTGEEDWLCNNGKINC